MQNSTAHAMSSRKSNMSVAKKALEGVIVDPTRLSRAESMRKHGRLGEDANNPNAIVEGTRHTILVYQALHTTDVTSSGCAGFLRCNGEPKSSSVLTPKWRQGPLR